MGLLSRITAKHFKIIDEVNPMNPVNPINPSLAMAPFITLRHEVWQ